MAHISKPRWIAVQRGLHCERVGNEFAHGSRLAFDNLNVKGYKDLVIIRDESMYALSLCRDAAETRLADVTRRIAGSLYAHGLWTLNF